MGTVSTQRVKEPHRCTYGEPSYVRACYGTASISTFSDFILTTDPDSLRSLGSLSSTRSEALNFSYKKPANQLIPCSYCSCMSGFEQQRYIEHLKLLCPNH